MSFLSTAALTKRFLTLTSERKMQILCNKDEAVMLLRLAEELCPRIIPKISRDWLAM